MKTQTNNLRKFAATVCVALLFTAGSFTQSGTANRGDNSVSSAGLETMINRTEQLIRYSAPAEYESEAAVSEMERLDKIAAFTEASLKYEAPALNDVTPEMERLDWLAAANEASLQYCAPEVNDFDETGNTLQNTAMYTNRTR